MPIDLGVAIRSPFRILFQLIMLLDRQEKTMIDTCR